MPLHNSGAPDGMLPNTAADLARRPRLWRRAKFASVVFAATIVAVVVAGFLLESVQRAWETGPFEPRVVPSAFARGRYATLATPGPCAPTPRAGALAADQHRISAFLATVLVPRLGVHPIPLAEQALMASAACFLEPTVVFEWGTHIGFSARVWHEVRAHFGLAYDIHSFDLPPDVAHVEHPGSQRGLLVRDIADQLELHTNDAVANSARMWNERYRGEPRALPLFFLDGDHTFDTVLRELTAIYRAVGCRAQFLLHDTLPRPSATSAFHEGPWLAAQAFLAEVARGEYRVLSTHTGLPGMTLLYSTDRCPDITS